MSDVFDRSGQWLQAEGQGGAVDGYAGSICRRWQRSRVRDAQGGELAWLLGAFLVSRLWFSAPRWAALAVMTGLPIARDAEGQQHLRGHQDACEGRTAKRVRTFAKSLADG